MTYRPGGWRGRRGGVAVCGCGSMGSNGREGSMGSNGREGSMSSSGSMGRRVAVVA